VPVASFNAKVEDARVKANQFYQDLLRDFDVTFQKTELRKRMEGHFEQKVMYYHERIRRWVGDHITKQKDEVSQFLATLELPMDPDTLKRQAEKLITEFAKRFTKELTGFGASGARVSLGRAAQMPAFSQEPTAQLASDLRALQGTRELENEREIMHVFKLSTQAAHEAVENELKPKGSNQLVGKARMKELMKVVELKCWTAFDEVLGKHKWMILLNHYKTHRALVQTESYESQTNRFVAANEQRLSAHFRTAHERTANLYRTKQAAISLPVSETELETELRQLRTTVKEALEEQGKDLTDTSAFKHAFDNLKSVMKEGYEDVRQKNVDLWTVHSDQARKCALRRNHATEQTCNLFCFFNKVPRIHKTTSQQHLFECFGQGTVGSRMSPKMQVQVFENWYAKDLAMDATRVWNHFYILSALIGIVMLFFVSICLRVRSNPMQQQQGYYGQGMPQTGAFGSTYGQGMPGTGMPGTIPGTGMPPIGGVHGADVWGRPGGYGRFN